MHPTSASVADLQLYKCMRDIIIGFVIKDQFHVDFFLSFVIKDQFHVDFFLSFVIKDQFYDDFSIICNQRSVLC
jgi:hypothetical protein